MADDLIYSRTQIDFVESILDTVRQHDGQLLDDLLNVTRMYQVEDLDFNSQDEPNFDQQLPNDHDLLWKLLSQHHWHVCRCLASNDIDRAFRHQSRKLTCFLNLLNIYSNRLTSSTADDEHELGQYSNDDDPTWLLPVFNRHLHELRLLALLGNDESNSDDTEIGDTTNSNSTIQTLNSQLSQQTTNTIQRFPLANKFRKMGIFIIVNQMLKTYYALHKFNLCTYAIQKAERPLKLYVQEETTHQDHRYSSYVLTYRYFFGKHLLLKHDYSSAIEHFDYVFTNCLHVNQSGSITNKKQALLYLVVLKMLHGSTPKMSLLEKYELYELIDIIEPIRIGSLKLFLVKLREYEQFLFDTGLLFLIENFKLITIRNLFRIYAYQIEQQQQIDRIPLDTALFLVNFEEEYFTINELIDILNNMIDKGMIKGYISYKHRTLVISRKDPFPKDFRFTSLLNSS